MGFVADIFDPFGFFHDSAWIPGGSKGRSMYGDRSSRNRRNDLANEKKAAERTSVPSAAQKQAAIEAESAEKARRLLINPNPGRLVSSSGLTGNTSSGSSARRKLLGA